MMKVITRKAVFSKNDHSGRARFLKAWPLKNPGFASVTLSLSFLLTFSAATISSPRAFAQSATSSGSSEKLNDFLMGGTSISIGTFLMVKGCGKPEPMSMMLCVTGAAGAAQGMMNVAQGFMTSNSTDPITGTATPTGTVSGSSDYGSLPPALQTAIGNAQTVAKQNGVDLTNPDSVAAFSAAHGGGLDANGNPPDLSSLSPDIVAGMNKAKADFVSGFHVASVGTDDGGGAGGRGGARGTIDGLDIAALMNKGNDRKPSSIEGLQKTFGGEPIGVAGDNIFHQVTRRYQAKIHTIGFLPPTSLLSDASAVKKAQYQSKGLYKKSIN